MKHVVVGGAGFLGSNLANKLMEKGESVLIFDRETADYSRLRPLHKAQLKIVMGNFSVSYPFTQLLEPGDVVYHLICSTNPGLSNKDMICEIQENVLPTVALLDACAAKKINKIVFLSSGGTVYGQTTLKPFRETDSTNPISSYGVQKLTIEKYLKIFNHISMLDYRIVRLSNPYGPFQNPQSGLGAVTAFTYRVLNGEAVTIYGDGNITRDYIYVSDAIEGILRIAKYDGGEKLFNLGSGKGITLTDVLQTVEKALGRKADVRYLTARNVDVPYNVLDISKYRQIADDIHPTPLEDGIRLLAEFFEKGAEKSKRKDITV